jgi:hypothetical protein
MDGIATTLPLYPVYPEGEDRNNGPMPGFTQTLSTHHLTFTSFSSLRKIIHNKHMHSSQDHMEDDAELPDVDPRTLDVDPRTLVTALTQQLVLEDSTSPLEVEEQGAPVLHLIDRNLIDRTATHAVTSTADAVLREITSSRSVGVFHDDGRETSLPAFLSDSQVRAALHRANSLRPQGHLSDEPQFPSSLTRAQPQFQAERDLRDAPARPFYPVTGYPDSFYPSINPEHSGVPTRFVPGQETASVLKITKRPHLRPKDISHRQSLGSGEQESSSSAFLGGNAFGFTSPPSPLDGRFLHGGFGVWEAEGHCPGKLSYVCE